MPYRNWGGTPGSLPTPSSWSVTGTRHFGSVPERSWRKKLLGYLFVVPLLVFSILTGIGILATFLVAGSQGMPTNLVVEAVIAVIIAVSLVLSVLYVREVKEYSGVSIV